MNFVTKRCIRKSIRLLLWWTHYSFPGVRIVGPKELFALELLPTEYLLTNLNASSGAGNDVCTRRSQDTGFICLAWRAPLGYYKAEHRFDKPNPYFLVRSIVQIDLLCVTRRLRYQTLRAAMLVSYLPRGAGVGVYSGRNRPPPPQ